MEIREFIEHIRMQRELSFGELSDRLEYRSKTSLARLMRGESDVRGLESFGRRVKAHLNPSMEELHILKQLLQNARNGDNRSALEMEAFLRMDVGDEVEIQLETCECQTDLLSVRYEGARDMRIVLLNCQYVPLFQLLCRWIRNQGAQVEHYMLIAEDPARTIHSVTALLPVVYEKNYAGYILDRPIDQLVRGMQSADSMVVTYATDTGDIHEDLIVFDRPEHGYIMSSEGHNTVSRILGLPWEGYLPIKRTYFQCTMMEDYVQYSRDYAELEKDCAQYIIKPDPCIDLIPTEVLKAAFLDRCGDVGKPLVDVLVDIYEQRFQNILHKRKPTHYIMKRQAMWRFIRTGQTLDHFWGMRPYTIKERICILENMIQQAENNPFYNLYFLENDDLLRDIQIGYYEGKGLLIADAQTSFNLAEGHSEILITQSEFLEQYKAYFLKHLLKDGVLSFEGTKCILYECLKYCMTCADNELNNIQL